MEKPAEKIEIAYEQSKGFLLNHQTMTGAARKISAATGMAQSSAMTHVINLRHMLRGERYRRRLSAQTTEAFLDFILRDYGQEGLRRALSALMQHIEYYEATSGTNSVSDRAIHARFKEIAEREQEPPSFPDEVQGNPEQYVEGAVKQVLVNMYERSQEARNACIAHYGCKCTVCGFDFESAYGELGRGYIHVHHLQELSTIGAEYVVDYIAHLRPVCPNCHAMLHRTKPSMSIEELQKQLKTTVLI